jgi:SAM-dependent methyltransferase
MTERDEQKLYDAFYFAHGCGEPYQRSEDWLNLFNGFAERIVRDIQPGSVLDAGCAMGFLVEALRNRGVEAWGVDISEYAISNVAPEMKEFCWIGSVTEPFSSRYDLIVSNEVLEHLEKEDSEMAVKNLCQHSDDILFSSTPNDYKEVSHFNVQPPEYWAELFAREGFFRDVDFDASFITPWAVRYRKVDEPLHRIVRNYERKFWLLWKENSDLRDLTIELREDLAVSESITQQSGAHSEGIIRGLMRSLRRK